MISTFIVGTCVGGLLSWMTCCVIYDALVRGTRAKLQYYYMKKYNEQMSELQVRYRQERVAMIHRHEGQLADIQKELEMIAFIVDKDKTKKVFNG